MISAHALVRWLERVEGLDLSDIRREILAAGGDTTNPYLVLKRIEEVYGISRKDVARQILTPFVRSAVLSGATRINTPIACFPVVNGTIITVYTPRMKAHRLIQLQRESAILVNRWKRGIGFNRERLAP